MMLIFLDELNMGNTENNNLIVRVGVTKEATDADGVQ